MVAPRPTITADRGFWLPIYRARYEAAQQRDHLVKAAAAILRIHDDELIVVLDECGLWSMVEAMAEGSYLIEQLRKDGQAMPDGAHAWRIYANKLRRNGAIRKPNIPWRHEGGRG